MKTFKGLLKGLFLGLAIGIAIDIVFAVFIAILRFKIADPFSFMAIHSGSIQMDGSDTLFSLIWVLGALIGAILGAKKAKQIQP